VTTYNLCLILCDSTTLTNAHTPVAATGKIPSMDMLQLLVPVLEKRH
jgi:hypothetical protein